MSLHRIGIVVTNVSEGVSNVIVELSCRKQEAGLQYVDVRAWVNGVEVLHTQSMNIVAGPVHAYLVKVAIFTLDEEKEQRF